VSGGRFDRYIIGLASWAPIRLVGEYGPERLLLNFGCVLIGIGGLVEEPSGVLESWPAWFVVEWALAMILGGLCALWGIARQSRTVEWVGYVCIGAAALVFGASCLWVLGWEALRVATMFLAIAAAKGVRLLLSYAARAGYLRTNGTRPS
jgi:hypothetical protein